MTRYFVDLFSGAGGLSYGLSCAGFECLYANELNPTYANTYQKNHAYVHVETNDIRNVDALDVMTRIGIKPYELDLIAGGPPCQGFSINAPVRSNEDHRNHLFRDYLRFVEVFKPKAVLIENVPGLVSFENGATLRDILKSLEKLGYAAKVRILGAAYYGVPQSRWRTIILAIRGKELPAYAYPKPTNNAPIKPNFRVHYQGESLVELPSQAITASFTTVEQAIGDLPKIKAGEKYQAGGQYSCVVFSEYQRDMRKGSTGIWNHEAAGISNINQERFSFIKPGGNWTDIPIELLPKGMQRAKRSDHTKRYGRVRPDELASTILTKCDPHWGAFIHYAQDRAFSVREAARIQSFPDKFIFTGSLSEQYAQVGNAVPPLLAKAVGHSLMNVLDAML